MLKKIVLYFLLLLIVGCDQKPKTVVDLEGRTINFKEYNGKWIVINYWASWCGHCLKELPELNRFYNKHKDKVLVFGVNYDQIPLEQLKPIVKKLSIQFPTLITDPAANLGIGHVDAIPVTYTISPEGNVSKPIVGEQTLQTLEALTSLQQ